jgi:hypothetical protein
VFGLNGTLTHNWPYRAKHYMNSNLFVHIRLLNLKRKKNGVKNFYNTGLYPFSIRSMLRKKMGQKVVKVNSLGNTYDEPVQDHSIQHNGLLKDVNIVSC